MLGIDPRAARLAWTYSLVVLLFVAAYLVRKTLLLFVLAIMFAYLLYPLVDAIERRLRWKTRLPAIAFPFVLIFGLLTIFGLIVRPQVRHEMEDLKRQVHDQNFEQNVAQWSVMGFPIGKELIDSYNNPREFLNFMPQLGRGFRAAVRDFTNLFIVPILSFLLLKDGRWMCDSLLEIGFGGTGGTASSGRRAVENIMRDAHTLILEYMRALFFLCLATLICFSVALRIMHVKYAILLALLAFVLEFVPLVGPLTSAIVILGVCEFNHYPHIFRVVLFLVIYRLFQDYVLSPHLMEKGVKLHPLLIMFGVFAGGELGGIGGIFLSVPLLALGRLVYYELRMIRITEKELVPVA